MWNVTSWMSQIFLSKQYFTFDIVLFTFQKNLDLYFFRTWCDMMIILRGGALNFFQVGVCGPDFRSVGLAN